MQPIELRPSSAERWMTCTGSASLLAASGKGEGKETDATLEGTAAHALFEQAIDFAASVLKSRGKDFQTAKLVQVLDEYAQEKLYPGGEVPADMVNAVLEALSEVLKMVRSYRQVHDLRASTEVRLDLTWAGVEGLEGGTADLLLTHRLNGEVVEVSVVDYKHGFRPVEATDNPQLLLYAVAALRRLEVKENIPVNLVILQPRLPGRTISTWQVQAHDVWNWFATTLQPAAIEASAGTGKLRPSEAACVWCEAKEVCPALRKKMGWLGVAEMNEMTSAEKAEAVELLPIITDLVKRISAGVEEDMLAGGEQYAEHFKVVRKAGRRYFSEADAEVLRGTLGEAAFAVKPRSLTEIRKLLDEQGMDGQEWLNSNTSRTTDSHTVALLKDRRKAVKINRGGEAGG